MSVFNICQIAAIGLSVAGLSAVKLGYIPDQATAFLVGWLAALVPLSIGAILRIEQLLK